MKKLNLLLGIAFLLFFSGCSNENLIFINEDVNLTTYVNSSGLTQNYVPIANGNNTLIDSSLFENSSGFFTDVPFKTTSGKLFVSRTGKGAGFIFERTDGAAGSLQAALLFNRILFDENYDLIFSDNVRDNILNAQYAAAGVDYLKLESSTGNMYTVIDTGGNMMVGSSLTPSEKLSVNGNLFLLSDNQKIKLGGAKDVEMYWDGTNFIVNTNASGQNGLVYFSNNISTTGVITRTQVYDENISGDSQYNYVDSKDILINGSIIEKNMPEYVPIKVTDYNNWTLEYDYTKYCYYVDTEQIKENIDCFNKEYPNLVLYNQTPIYKKVYGTKLVDGRDLEKSVAKHEQTLYTYTQSFKVNQNTTDFNTTINSKAYYTSTPNFSKIKNQRGNFRSRLKDKNSYIDNTGKVNKMAFDSRRVRKIQEKILDKKTGKVKIITKNKEELDLAYEALQNRIIIAEQEETIQQLKTALCGVLKNRFQRNNLGCI